VAPCNGHPSSLEGVLLSSHGSQARHLYARYSEPASTDRNNNNLH